VANPFVHVELLTTDVGKAKSFYSDLFEWKMEDSGGAMPYTVIDVGGQTGGGMMRVPNPEMPSAWFPYVYVEDLEAATKKVTALGGTVMQGITEVPGYGWLAVIADPTGAVIGLWKNKPE
jgi:uncharacterized protein